MTTSHAERLSVAMEAREQGRDEEARRLLLELHQTSPDDAAVNLQCAWIHDKLGEEARAVPFYEKALEAGIDGQDLHDALLGLGSTYRALGRYEDSLRTLDRGVSEFPDDPAMRVFRAMALYNTGDAKAACEVLLTILATSGQGEQLARYGSAIAEYANDLDRTWQ